ncbi:hypothetical protein GCM10023169_41270 [Georgenia halophila]|uniref:Uncharacterized protein n=1 Tax=Georgenia halophila TaxID=620889 RepID=A0ABP8LS47_9MICO
MSDARVIDIHANDDRYPTDLPVLDSVNQVVRLIQTTGELFLRVSADGDNAGPRDPESGYRLPGAPCFALVPEPWWLDSTESWVARQLVSRAYLITGGARARVLAGTVVGRGVDGQPLVAPTHPLARVERMAFVEAESVYAAWRCRHV